MAKNSDKNGNKLDTIKEDEDSDSVELKEIKADQSVIDNAENASNITKRKLLQVSATSSNDETQTQAKKTNSSIYVKDIFNTVVTSHGT